MQTWAAGRTTRDDPEPPKKLFLCGPAGSGKSTVFKQAVILKLGGFTDEEREMLKLEMRAALLRVFSTVNAALGPEALGLDHAAGEEGKAARAEAVSASRHSSVRWRTEKSKAVCAVPEDWVAIMPLLRAGCNSKQRALEEHLESQGDLSEQKCARYIMDHAERIISVDFMPVDDDILNFRMPTAGVQELLVPPGRKGYPHMKLVDVPLLVRSDEVRIAKEHSIPPRPTPLVPEHIRVCPLPM